MRCPYCHKEVSVGFGLDGKPHAKYHFCEQSPAVVPMTELEIQWRKAVHERNASK